ncbi:MAG: polysaccharide biosynthesis tyrosine autokinase [Rhodobacteraceae bacterium]|nr:polysaccharide biosynthesis tyrosine autokinase [Paracoccaceae bacterium]
MNDMREVTASASVSGQDDDDQIDLVALGRVLWRGKVPIFAVTLILVVFAAIYAFVLATPKYDSTAVVSMNTQQSQMMSSVNSVLSALGTDSSTINTETIVLQSRNLLEKVVNKLDLVNDPEFNAVLEPTPFAQALQSAKDRVKTLLGIALAPEPTDSAIHDAVIDQLLSQITVTNEPNSMAFDIDVTTLDPNKSALIANTIVALYINDQKLEKLAATKEASQFLTQRTAVLQEQLQAAENKLSDFNHSTQLVSADALTALQVQLKDIRDRLSRLRSDRESTAKRAADLSALVLAGNPEAFGAFADDPAISTLVDRLNAGTITQADFNDAANALVQRAKTAVQRDDEQIAALAASEQVQSDQITQQSKDLIKLQELQREVDSTQTIYDTFLTQLKQTDVQLGLALPDSMQLSSAVPRPAVSPKKPLILVLAAILGIMIGSGIVLLRELQFASFRTSDELRSATGLRVLGSIPVIPSHSRKDALGYLRDKPTSIIAEAVRNLRTSILLSNIDHPPKVLMITSSLPGEGKTTETLALALNMANLGKRVILIEGDLRRRIFSEYFDTKHAVTLLSAMNDHTEVLQHDLMQPEVGVDLLVAAKANVNAADVFASEKFASLIAMLREHYDFVLIDTPPVLVVPDARVIAHHADAIVYTVKWNSTSRTQLRQGLEMFSSLGIPISGLVLNQVDSRQMKRYGYGGQYGYDVYKSKYYDQT